MTTSRQHKLHCTRVVLVIWRRCFPARIFLTGWQAVRAKHPEGGLSRLASAGTDYLERALADYNRTLAWVDCYPAIANESRLPFFKKRREVYLKLGRKAEAEVDERELKSASTRATQP